MRLRFAFCELASAAAGMLRRRNVPLLEDATRGTQTAAPGCAARALPLAPLRCLPTNPVRLQTLDECALETRVVPRSVAVGG